MIENTFNFFLNKINVPILELEFKKLNHYTMSNIQRRSLEAMRGKKHCPLQSYSV